jgi:hypothetical protein
MLPSLRFSPGDKLYCFGQPDTNVVLDSYIKGTTEFEDSKSTENFLTCKDYNRQYEVAQKTLATEKKKLEDVQNMAKIFNKGDMWNDQLMIWVVISLNNLWCPFKEETC